MKGILELFDNMRESVRCIGAKKTVEVLQKAKVDSSKIDFIISAVLVEFNNEFSKSDLIKKNIRGEKLIARNMVFILANKLKIFTSTELSMMVENVYRYTIRNVICNYNKLDRNNKIDKSIIDRHEKVLLKIKTTK